MAPTNKSICFFDSESRRLKEWGAILQEVNYDVALASSETEALQVLQKKAADLAIISTNALGATFFQELRKTKGGKGAKLVVFSPSSELLKKLEPLKGKKGGVDAVATLPLHPIDLVDYVEQLVGLPFIPSLKATPSQAEPKPDAQVRELQKEVEALLEQVHFYQKQLDQISVVGEKETREIDQVLKDLQEELDRSQKENEQLKEEIKLVRGDLGKKDREILEKEKELGSLHEDSKREISQMKSELESLRNVHNDQKEQHKKAQSALRDYYKAKMDKFTKTENRVDELETELAGIQKTLESKEIGLQELEKDHEELKQVHQELSEKADRLEGDLKAERLKAKKAKETLALLTKALE